ncbi:MAG: CU044_5270 family protein [Mycobacteriales bacterium]
MNNELNDALLAMLREWPGEDIEPNERSWHLVHERLAKAITVVDPLIDSRRRSVRRARTLVAACALIAIFLTLSAIWLPSGSVGGPQSAAASAVEKAATSAERRPVAAHPESRQYLYLEMIEGRYESQSVISHNRSFSYRFFLTQLEQYWIAPDGTGRLTIAGYKAAHFASAHDRASWARSGQPFPVTAHSSTEFKGPRTSHMPFAALGRLPTSYKALEKVIVDRFEAGKSNPYNTMVLAAQILEASPYPSVRAGLFRLIAHLPGLTLFGTTRDQLGRRGLAVGFLDFGIRNELIYDPQTTSVLEDLRVSVGPQSVTSLPPGTILGYRVYVNRGLVKSLGQLPARFGG